MALISLESVHAVTKYRQACRSTERLINARKQNKTKPKQSIECEEGRVMLIASIVTVKVFRFRYHALEISIGLINVK